jgi:hypothetical protein
LWLSLDKLGMTFLLLLLLLFGGGTD